MQRPALRNPVYEDIGKTGEARRLVGGPLGLAAAREALARTPDGAVIAILTGFPEFPWIRRGVAETDGPVGAAVLARSFIKARRAIPILPCEPHFAAVIEAAVRGIGLTPRSEEHTSE